MWLSMCVYEDEGLHGSRRRVGMKQEAGMCDMQAVKAQVCVSVGGCGCAAS